MSSPDAHHPAPEPHPESPASAAPAENAEDTAASLELAAQVAGASGARMYVVRRRRTPRLGRIVMLGVIAGVIAMLVIGYMAEARTATDLTYFALVGGVAGGVIGSVVALVLERLSRGN